MEQVLMVDDDAELCEMLAEYLKPEGFGVCAAHDGVSGLEQARSGAYALMLLDVMLPGLNGFEVLRRLRASESPGAGIPILMLTARGQAVDRVVGLEVGADDYLAKPFDERELVARMRAILRRSPARATSTPMPMSMSMPMPATIASEVVAAPPEQVTAGQPALRVGDVMVDGGARMARCGAQVLVLTAVEFDLLVLLLRAAGTVVSRTQITKDVLDRKLVGFDRSVDTHISRLRRKLGPHPDGGERIKTVRSIGYIYTLPSPVSR